MIKNSYTAKKTTTEKNRVIGDRKNAEAEAGRPVKPESSILANIPITTRIYIARAVDTMFDQLVIGTDKIAIEDEDIPGDFYTLTVKSGRLILRKLGEPPEESQGD